MEEHFVVAVALVAVLAVGAVGLIGLMGTQSGAAVTSTNSCMCQMTLYDYYGNAMGTQQQLVRASPGKVTPQGCQNVCETLFTPGTNKKVVGTPA